MQINRKPPVITIGMIILCAIFFLAEIGLTVWAFGASAVSDALAGGGANTQILFLMGAKENYSITVGQWWRLFMPMLLHSGVAHLAFNCFALYSWGRQAEALLGRLRYITVYVLAGFAGCCASYAFSQSLSVGASGAIFGVFGALLYFRTRHKEVFNRVFGTQVIVIIAINIFYGFTNGQVDNFGHLGGLAGGFLASCAVGLFGERELTARRALAAIGYMAVFGGILLFGYLRYAPYVH